MARFVRASGEKTVGMAGGVVSEDLRPARIFKLSLAFSTSAIHAHLNPEGYILAELGVQTRRRAKPRKGAEHGAGVTNLLV